jgi:uncharacterized protein YbjT (DUF2867 family)
MVATTTVDPRPRRALVLGATGFLGSHIVAALARAGWRVTCGSRAGNGAACDAHVRVDFQSDVTEAAWAPRLAGVDVVVNAVGIAAERRGASFHAIHDAAPRALFRACAARGVRVVQVSALGADTQAQSRFHLSKRSADEELLALHDDAWVVQPSLVFGPGGTSAALFTMLASLPVVPLPGSGRQQVQPLHVDDVAAAIVALASRPPVDEERRIALVGPRAVELQDLLAALRARMGLPRARFVRVPLALARFGMRIGAVLRPGWLSTELLDMLERGNTADPGATVRVLGYLPRPVAERIDGNRERIVASSLWLVPLLRGAIAVVWLAAAAVSLGLYPLEDSVAMVERTGLHGALALAAVYAGAVVDACFGIATLLARRTRYLWIAQIVVIVAYTIILTIAIPETWLHPFGPVVKNLPLLVAIVLVSRMSRR